MSSHSTFSVLANGAIAPKKCIDPITIDYRTGKSCDQKIHISLPKFVINVNHLNSRTLDLLELASYVFAVDRMFTRGDKDAVEYHSWSRRINFYIRVRDYQFWISDEIRRQLMNVLQFIMGDAEFKIHFQPNHRTDAAGLFDDEEFQIDAEEESIQVALFSGGIDSLAGALNFLEQDSRKLILASHVSSPSSLRTQKQLISAIDKKYYDRVRHYKFECNLKARRAKEETQRSRGFLFCCIAFALARANNQAQFHIYENGVTSMNLMRREDLMNARASRTTHPKTMIGLQNIFEIIYEKPFEIRTPFILKTKADVTKILCSIYPDLLSSSVSCGRTSFARGEATHCGTCFQCIDRRITSYAAEAESNDHNGLYTYNILADPLEHDAKTTAIDYIRQAIEASSESLDSFYYKHLYELAEILDFLPFSGKNNEKIEKIWDLFRRHGIDVKKGLSRMRNQCDDIFGVNPQKGTLFNLISSREYLKADEERLADTIENILESVGEMFSKEKPKNEPDLNAKIGALLRSHDSKIKSECPTVSFACAGVIPDHSKMDANVLIESKYIRGATTPSVATEGIAADLTKCQKDKYIIFAVYDPEHKIKNDKEFRTDIESRGRNRVVIMR